MSVAEYERENIFFLDHEIVGDDAFSRIANTLEDFLHRLQPFDLSQVELPGDTEGVSWIDPDFLKSLADSSN